MLFGKIRIRAQNHQGETKAVNSRTQLLTCRIIIIETRQVRSLTLERHTAVAKISGFMQELVHRENCLSTPGSGIAYRVEAGLGFSLHSDFALKRLNLKLPWPCCLQKPDA